VMIWVTPPEATRTPSAETGNKCLTLRPNRDTFENLLAALSLHRVGSGPRSIDNETSSAPFCHPDKAY